MTKHFSLNFSTSDEGSYKNGTNKKTFMITLKLNYFFTTKIYYIEAAS